MKRFFDLIFTVQGIVILLPFFIIIAVLVKLDSPGPVFYLQERVGKNGRIFKIYKFRTMINDADKIGPAITVGDDPRITRWGYVFRKHKLDELPQLINVLKGEMSLVGPRPEVPKYVDMYSKDQMAVLNLLPGITDPASIKYRTENELLAATRAEGVDVDPEWIYVNEIMPDKIKINLEYATKANILSDFVVIMKTILG
jgi:lipopolysaccharide/colanic/teichoic acid biosynthesis glycosyltransferase